MKLLSILIVIYIANCFASNLTKTSLHGQKMMGRHSSDIDCMDVKVKCRGIPECDKSLKNLRKKCRIIGGRCAGSRNSEFCAELQKKLFSYGFPEKQCRCRTISDRCFNIQNSIYSNPCIQNDYTNIVKKGFDDSNLPLDEVKPSGLSQNETPDVSTTSVVPVTNYDSFDGPIFGDEGFAVTPFKERRTKFYARRAGEDHYEKEREKVLAIVAISPSSLAQDEGEIATVAVTKYTTESTYESTDEYEETTISYVNHLDLLRIKLEKESLEITQDMKLRIASIVIGSIFVVAILMGGLFLAWKRIKKSHKLYKKGKAVQHKDEMMS